MTNPFLRSRLSWNPHSYQRRAIRLLLSQGSAGLFLDPGLGKTSVVLAAFKLLKKKGLARKMLIIAPLRPVYKVWPDEIEKWEDFHELTYTILHGPDKEENLQKDCDLYIINPEGLLWLFAEKLKQNLRPEFDILCVDESSRFKNSQTKRFKLLKPLLSGFKRRWILTGTPVPNGLEDLFGQIYILDLGRSLGRYITHFRNSFFVRTGFNLYSWQPRPGAFAEVVDKISALVLQLSAEEYLSMPELISSNVTVKLSSEVMETYRQVEEDFLTLLESGNLVAANAAVAGIKCRQIANGAVYIDGSEWVKIHDEKLDALESLLGELGGAPTLLLYEFDHDRQRILERFPDIPTLGSGLSPRKLDGIINRFNAGEIPVLLGHPASMGHGLNLQGSCHHVIWYGITWNLEHYEQAIARVHRQGQKSEHVFVYHIIAKNTLDEKVIKTLTMKDKRQSSLLQALHDYRQEHLDRV
jgi:SNF2 family DNA or RNA helicase